METESERAVLNTGAQTSTRERHAWNESELEAEALCSLCNHAVGTGATGVAAEGAPGGCTRGVHPAPWNLQHFVATCQGQKVHSRKSFGKAQSASPRPQRRDLRFVSVFPVKSVDGKSKLVSL